jgi:hypothetical protein
MSATHRPVRTVWGQLAGHQIIVRPGVGVPFGEPAPTTPSHAVETLASHEPPRPRAARPDVAPEPQVGVHPG